MSAGEAAPYPAWWIEIAEGDLAMAEAILRNPELPPRGAAGLAQQAAEKALKAAIALDGHEPPRTHSLLALAHQVPERLAIDELSVDLAALTDAVGAARYPDPTELIYEPEEALRLVADARVLVTAVVAYFASEGSDVSRLTPR